jgi:hypothetical protein
MPLSSELESAADSKINALLTQLATIQEDYKIANLKYWQGLQCVDEIPADGNEVPVDSSVKPTDQAEDWDTAGLTLDTTLLVSLKVHEYNGPLGYGYVVAASVIENGILYSKFVNVGPENHRSKIWAEVTGPN